LGGSSDDQVHEVFAGVRERAVRLLGEHRGEYGSEWEAMRSIAAEIGCSAETLRAWVRRAQVDAGRRPGLASDERAQLKALQRENRELRRRTRSSRPRRFSSRRA
jgi:transposase